MASRKKNQKKAEETLVDIVEVRDQAQSFVDRNQNIVLGGLLVIVLIIGGIFAYSNFYQQPRQQEAMEQMYQAQVQFQRDSFALALTNPGGGYLGFLDIIDSYGSTDAGNLANYYAGISYLNLGQFEAAIDFLNDFDPAGDITPIMKYGALGDAYSELNDLENALDYYEDAVSAGDNDMLTPYYLKKVGMLHEKNGSFAQAKAAYERIKEEYPSSSVGQDIEKFIIRVSAKG